MPSYKKCPNCGKEHQQFSSSTLISPIKECKKCGKIYCESCEGYKSQIGGQLKTSGCPNSNCDNNGLYSVGI